MLQLLSMAIPPPWNLVAKFALPAVLCGLVFGYGYVKGASHVRAEWAVETLERENALLSALGKHREVEQRVVYQYIDRVRVVREKARIVEKKVPVYVPSEADLNCSINRGFVWLHDNAATGGLLPSTAGGVTEPAPGITLSRVAERVADNYARCRENAEQLRALQEWAKGVTSDEVKD